MLNSLALKIQKHSVLFRECNEQGRHRQMVHHLIELETAIKLLRGCPAWQSVEQFAAIDEAEEIIND